MRNFDINPLDYSDYATNRLYDGERVYHFSLNDGSEAYAIREEDEGMEDFTGEVEWDVRRRKGSRAHVRNVDDVTGTFDHAKGCQVHDSSALADLLDIHCDYDELDEDARDAIEELFEEMTVIDYDDCNRYWDTSIGEEETNALIERYSDRIWTEDGSLRMAAAGNDEE